MSRQEFRPGREQQAGREHPITFSRVLHSCCLLERVGIACLGGIGYKTGPGGSCGCGWLPLCRSVGTGVNIEPLRLHVNRVNRLF